MVHTAETRRPIERVWDARVIFVDETGMGLREGSCVLLLGCGARGYLSVFLYVVDNLGYVGNCCVESRTIVNH